MRHPQNAWIDYPNEYEKNPKYNRLNAKTLTKSELRIPGKKFKIFIENVVNDAHEAIRLNEAKRIRLCFLIRLAAGNTSLFSIHETCTVAPDSCDKHLKPQHIQNMFRVRREREETKFVCAINEN